MTRREWLYNQYMIHIKGMSFQDYVSEQYGQYVGFCLTHGKMSSSKAVWLNEEN